MSENDQHLLDNAMDSDFELETIIADSHESYVKLKKILEKGRKEAFKSAIDAFVKQGDSENLAIALRLFGDKSVNCPIVGAFSQGSSNKSEVSESFFSEIEKGVARYLTEKAEKLYEKAVSPNDIPYKFRNNWLEKAIRILLDLCDRSDSPEWKHDDIKPSWQIYHFISENYLKRGLSVLPKGKGVSAPEKKIQAMTNALEWVDKAEEKVDNELAVAFTRVRILYELYRMDKRGYEKRLAEAAKKAVNMSSEFNPNTPFGIFVLGLYCQFHSDTESDRLILSKTDIQAQEDVLPSPSFVQARAAYRLYKKEASEKDDIAQQMMDKAGEAVKNMDRFDLFSPIWDDLIGYSL